MNSHDIRLPNFIAIYAVGGPYFVTKLAVTNSGREVRLSERQYALQKYKIKNCVLSQQQFAEFNSFFRSRYGMRYCFRFKDFADYKVVKQLTAEYPSDKTEFNFIKIYNDGNFVYERPILKPIFSSIEVFINDKKIEPIIDKDGLKIILNQKLQKGENLYISFEFDVNVRFYSDHFNCQILDNGSILIEDLDLVEVRDDQ